MTTEIKRLSPDTRSFEANGKKYIVHETLTTDGYIIQDELDLENAIGSSPRQLVKTLGKAVTKLNEYKFFEACTLIYNATGAAERIQERKPPPLLFILTLYVRPEGSDLSKWDEATAREWIEDWNMEGYSINDLFNLADACRIRFALDLERNFQNISEVEESEKGKESL